MPTINVDTQVLKDFVTAVVRMLKESEIEIEIHRAVLNGIRKGDPSIPLDAMLVQARQAPEVHDAMEAKYAPMLEAMLDHISRSELGQDALAFLKKWQPTGQKN